MAYCDSAWIRIYPSGNVSAWGYNWHHPNTIVMIDDLQWVYPTTNIVINKEVINLEKVYPNPSKNIVSIVYTVPYKSKVSIKIVDSKGSLLETVISSEEQLLGRYKAEVDISKLSTGVYYIEIVNELGFKSSTKLIVE